MAQFIDNSDKVSRQIQKKFEKVKKAVNDSVKKTNHKLNANEKAIRKEIDRMKTTINKRMDRLRRNDLTQTPAYQHYLTDYNPKFSVKGKSYNQLQSEYWILKGMIGDCTGTVKGATQYLKNVADATGFGVRTTRNGNTVYDMRKLKKESGKFFELAEKVKDYYESIGQAARAMDYRRIFEMVNDIERQQKGDWDSVDIKAMVTKMDELNEQSDTILTQGKKDAEKAAKNALQS